MRAFAPMQTYRTFFRGPVYIDRPGGNSRLVLHTVPQPGHNQTLLVNCLRQALRRPDTLAVANEAGAPIGRSPLRSPDVVSLPWRLAHGEAATDGWPRPPADAWVSIWTGPPRALADFGMFSTDPLKSAAEAGVRYVRCGGASIHRAWESTGREAGFRIAAVGGGNRSVTARLRPNAVTAVSSVMAETGSTDQAKCRFAS